MIFENIIAALINKNITVIANMLKARGDVLKARKFVRQRFFAPLHHSLHKPEIAAKIAADIVAYVFMPNKEMSLLEILGWSVIDATVLAAKRQLIKDMILRQALHIQEHAKVELREESFEYVYVEGKDEMEEFIRALLTVVGG